MAITKTTVLGPQSVAINYAIDADATSILDAIEAFITTVGWDLWDADAGTNMRTYRALNEDGVSYKYAIINLGNADYLYINVYEAWDATLHTGTNLSYDSGTASFAQRMSLKYSGYIYLFASPRWLVIQTKENTGALGSSSGYGWTGCLEIAKDNDGEVAGDFPIYAWANAYRFMGVDAASTNIGYCFSLPRNISNQTGTGARNYNTVGTLAGSTWDNNCELHHMIPFGTNPLSNTEDIFVFTPFAIGQVSNPGVPFHIRGRFYGMKILSSNINSFMDKVNIKCDADQFFLPTGTDQEHHVLTSNEGANRYAIPA